MMTSVSLGQQHSTPTQQFLPASFVPQYLPASSSQQFLPTPPPAPMLGSSPAPAPGGAYWLSQAPTPSAPMWTPTPSGIPRPLTSGGVQGAYTMPSTDARDRGDVVTGTISIDSFDAYVLFDSGASFSFVSEGFVVHTGISVQQIS